MIYALPAAPNATVPAHGLRRALGDVLAEVRHTPLPTPERLFLPKSLARALGRDELLVVGPAGSGKRFLLRLLASTSHRARLAALAPDARIAVETRVFALDVGAGDDPAALVTRLADRTHSRLASLTILATAAGAIPADHTRAWTARLAWVDAHADEIPKRLAEADAALDAAGADLFVLVSGIEAACATRAAGRRSVDGLLTSLPELVRTYGLRHIVPKLIVRDDLVDPTRHAGSSPAGRVIARRCVLHWPLPDLHGLHWHLLTTHPKHGELFRHLAFRHLVRSSLSRSPRWCLRRSTSCLYRRRGLCRPRPSLTRTRRRPCFMDSPDPSWARARARASRTGGCPHTWRTPTATSGRAASSPRWPRRWRTRPTTMPITTTRSTFAVSIPASTRLHVFGSGRSPSTPGVRPLMAALSGQGSGYRVQETLSGEGSGYRVQGTRTLNPVPSSLAVPFEFAEAEARWQETDALADADVVGAEIDSADSARKRLAELGVWREMKTGRIDVPDIFRLGFRLSRRGGVPLRTPGGIV